MNVIAPFVANTQPAEAVEPRPRALHDPTVTTEPLARLDAAARDPRRDAALSQRAPQRVRVVSLVGVQLLGPLARTPPPPAPDRHDGVHHCEQHPGVVDVGRAQERRERDAPALDHKMALRARFPAIRRIRAGFCAPLGAGTENASTEALDQSSWSASAKRASRTWCKRRQTPARCQSRSRRQQVAPDPQPISGGRYDHGSPVRSTKMMPRRASRSGTRGRPPFGLSTSGGSSGSTTAHNSSLTNGFAIASDFINPQPGF